MIALGFVIALTAITAFDRIGGRALIGLAVLLVLLHALFAAYLVVAHPVAIRSRKRLILLAILLLLVVTAARLSVESDRWPPEFVPISLASMIAVIVFGPRLAMETTFLLVMDVAIMLRLQEASAPLSVLAAGAFVAIVLCGRITNRSRIVKVGLLVGLVQAVALGASLLLRAPLDDATLATVFPRLAWTFGHGVIVGFVVSGSLPFIEAAFGIDTDVSLLELSNYSEQPLLQNLLIRAPGTYQHSMIVGNLAEEAARDVEGANPLIARVGGYYHDIGKMLKPEYFGENEEVPGSHHRGLSPTMSALIIAAHTKDGAELGRDHDLPQPILHIIESHHGTSLIQYFYREACDREGATDVREETFRYSGPKPQTKEAGIVMLADATEAASRSLGDPTSARIKTLIHKLAMDRLTEGQLDHCELSFAEIRVIEEAFLRVLAGIVHRRPRYPGAISATAPDDAPEAPPARPAGPPAKKREDAPAPAGD